MSTPDNRSVNFFSLFRRGQHYSKTWPLDNPEILQQLEAQGVSILRV